MLRDLAITELLSCLLYSNRVSQYLHPEKAVVCTLKSNFLVVSNIELQYTHKLMQGGKGTIHLTKKCISEIISFYAFIRSIN